MLHLVSLAFTQIRRFTFTTGIVVGRAALSSMSLPQLQVGGTGRFILRHFLGCVRCFFSSENGGESPEVPMTFRKCFSVSNQAEAAHRSTMAPSRHRVTLFVRF